MPKSHYEFYLKYASALPIFGNFFFAWRKVEHLLGKPATVHGWFLRGVTHHLELHKYTLPEEEIKSFVRFWCIAGTVLQVSLVGLIVLLLLSHLFAKMR